MTDACKDRFLTWISQKCGGSILGEVVVAEVCDAALAREAALREELQGIKEGMAYRGSLFGKVQAERDSLREELAKYRGLNDSLMARNLELTAAEQRNVELVELLKRIDRTPLDRWYRDALNVAVAAAIKPTESGASE